MEKAQAAVERYLALCLETGALAQRSRLTGESLRIAFRQGSAVHSKDTQSTDDCLIRKWGNHVSGCLRVLHSTQKERLQSPFPAAHSFFCLYTEKQWRTDSRVWVSILSLTDHQRKRISPESHKERDLNWPAQGALRCAVRIIVTPSIKAASAHNKKDAA